MKRYFMSTGNGAHDLKKSLVVLFLIISVVTIFFWQNGYVMFKVRNHETGEIIFSKMIKKDEIIKLEYIHSVTNQPVYEFFFIKDRHTLALKEMRYDSFGANLPVGPEKMWNEETQFIVEEGYYKILYQNRGFDVVPLRVGQVVADHTLVFENGERMRFLDFAEGGAYVEFYVQPLLNILV